MAFCRQKNLFAPRRHDFPDVLLTLAVSRCSIDVIDSQIDGSINDSDGFIVFVLFLDGPLTAQTEQSNLVAGFA
jgi:hypothetical protein